MQRLVAIALVLGMGGCAATGLPESRATTDAASARGTFVALSTPNADVLSRWYRAHLGFRVVQAGGSPDGRTRFALLRRNDDLLEIVQRAEAVAPPAARDASYRHGIFKLGFVVPDLIGEERALRASGAAFIHGVAQPAGNPLRSFAVRDPDGNTVQFFGP